VASENTSRNDLEVNPLLSRLVSHGVESSVFKGYVGPSDDDGAIRLYPSMGFLRFSIEIRRGDIVDTEPAPTSLLPYGGTVVWVRSDAQVVLHGDTVTTVPVRALQRPAPAMTEAATTPRVSESGNYVDIERGRLRMSVPAGRLGAGARMCDPGCASCRGCASTCGSPGACQVM